MGTGQPHSTKGDRMGCGPDGCHGPSLAYQAAAEISSKSSSKEDTTAHIVAANRTVITDMLRTHLADREQRLSNLDEERGQLSNEVTYLQEALFNLEQADRV